MALLLALALACRSRPANAGPEPCAPSTGALSPGTTGDALAGSYRLQLVATSGPGTGRSTTGALSLRPSAVADRYRSWAPGVRDTTSVYPLYGSLDAGLDAVGAVAGDATSADPARPGVLVIGMPARSQDAGPRIMLRLGAEANRRDAVRFDGGYTVLRVREITGGGFAGDWESGAPLPRAGGHFCAVKDETARPAGVSPSR